MGCNFPEIFEQRLGYQAEPNVESISAILSELKDIPFDHSRSERNRRFVADNYSEDKIVNDLFNMYAAIAGP
ncbi:MAG: hypothetical protein WDO15_10425 [Bacteroidota bacterium]